MRIAIPGTRNTTIVQTPDLAWSPVGTFGARRHQAHQRHGPGVNLTLGHGSVALTSKPSFRILGSDMKSLKIHVSCLVVVAGLLAATPARAVNRELVELQTQVQQMQDQMTAMKQSLDERMGVLKNLMDQNTDSINKVTSAIGNMQATLQKQQSDTTNHVDQLSGQMQALNDSLDELKARLGKVTKTLEDLQATQQNMAAQASQQAQQQQQQLNVPPPDVLYNNALRDYTGGNMELAKQEFNDYVKNYPNTDLAGNAF